MLRNTVRLAICLALICCVLQVSAQQSANSGIVPPVVKFGGVLTDVNGQATRRDHWRYLLTLPDQQGGAPLWVETQNISPDKSGHYTVTLGATTTQGLPANAFASGEARWLGVQVQGQAEQPRTVLMSVPYALKAADAETIGGLPATAFLKAARSGSATGSSMSQAIAGITGSGTANHITKWLSATKLGNSNIFDGTGNVGIATTSPGATLDVNGTAVIRSNATVKGSLGAGPITATSSSSGGTGVFANAGSSSASNGVIAEGATGVAAYTTVGGSIALYGDAGSSGGSNGVVAYGATGVAGYATVSGGIALYGDAGSSTASNGVVGYGATGVAGNSTITGSYGTFGSGSTGVWGNSTGTGANVGVYGTSGSGGNGFGVLGQSSSSNSSGGGFSNSTTGDALFTYNQSGGYAAFFDGDVDVDGHLSKASGSFKIDHPLDPGNKYLYHSFVESPDMMNIYNGNATTDASGSAVVTLPEWFETLNRDFRYQLTVMGQFAQAIVANKVANHQFTIKTDKPNVEVSWQVTGIRQDAWANAHRIQVEVAKAPADRGLYLHPELFGAPPEKSIALAHHPTMLKLMKQQAAKPQMAKRQQVAKQQQPAK